MKHLTRKQSREVDRIAIERLGFSGLVLMENAGRGAVDTLERLRIAEKDKTIGIVCGRGNNGGDGFVMARHLKIRGYRPLVVLMTDPGKLTGDALSNFSILRHCNVDIYSFEKLTPENRSEFERLLRGCNVLVDALLGTGATGPPRPPFDEAIRTINAQRDNPCCGNTVKIVAVDIPSGLDANTGSPNPPTVRADVTLTFYAEKTGFEFPEAASFTGKIYVQDIGTPPLDI